MGHGLGGWDQRAVGRVGCVYRDSTVLLWRALAILSPSCLLCFSVPYVVCTSPRHQAR